MTMTFGRLGKLRAQLEAAIAGGAIFAFSAGLTVDESRSVLRGLRRSRTRESAPRPDGRERIPVGA